MAIFFPQSYENLTLRLTGVGIWSQSLLIGLVVLFYFETGLACRAYLIGTGAACLAVILQGEGAYLLQREVLQQLPVHWFTIAALSMVKVGSKVQERERLAGMAAGLGSVAHELRTPRQDALSRIQFEVRHMQHMIDLFLMSASAVNRNLQPSQSLSMLAMVNAVLRRYSFNGKLQRANVTVDVRADFQFAGQDELCVVILLNLLRNALKAIQRAGKGRVRIIIDGVRPMHRQLFIDTGCGVAPARLPLIFERFYWLCHRKVWELSHGCLQQCFWGADASGVEYPAPPQIIRQVMAGYPVEYA